MRNKWRPVIALWCHDNLLCNALQQQICAGVHTKPPTNKFYAQWQHDLLSAYTWKSLYRLHSYTNCTLPVSHDEFDSQTRELNWLTLRLKFTLKTFCFCFISTCCSPCILCFWTWTRHFNWEREFWTGIFKHGPFWSICFFPFFQSISSILIRHIVTRQPPQLHGLEAA